MLSKDVLRTSVLRSIKSAFTYALVAPGADNTGVITDEAVLAILAKEAKKRQESADAYVKAGSDERVQQELAELAIIEEYLPAKLGEAELKALIETVVSKLDEVSPKAMGQVIGQVKTQAGAGADGALIARLVKERLAQ